MNWIFSIIALAGLVIQSYSIIYGNSIPERVHETSFNFMSFILGIIIVILFVYLSGIAGNYIAKQKWLPIILEKQFELYDISKQITENDGSE